jgi:hypothetical protein
MAMDTPMVDTMCMMIKKAFYQGLKIFSAGSILRNSSN